MKKVLSCFLIIVLTFSFFGCSAPEEQNAFPTEITKEPAWQDTQTDVKEPEKVTPPQTEKEPQNTNTDKAEPCKLTLENFFSEYEVVVTLTLEESSKNKTYTAKDFEDADIYYLYQKDDYFNITYQPEYKDRVTLFLYLNEPSKQNVLDTIKILEQDSRVYSACPNALERNEGNIVIDLSYSGKDEDAILTHYQETLLKSDKIESYYEFASVLTIKLKDKSMKNTINCIMDFKEKYSIESIVPDYHRLSTICISAYVAKEQTDFTINDFPYLELEKVEITELYLENVLYLYPKDKSIQYHMDAVRQLKEDKRIISVTPSAISVAVLD